MSNLQMSDSESLYYKSGNAGATAGGCLLSSNSRWLNSPVLRDLMMQDYLRRNGADASALELVPDVMNEFHRLLDYAEIDAILRDERRANPELSAWLDDRSTTLLDMATADRYAEGTLGAMLRDFYRSTGFSQVLAFGNVVPATDFEYFNKQRTLVHDIEHLITGFGTDPAGELGQMYMYLSINSRYFSARFSCFPNFIHAYLATTWMMRTNLHYPRVMPAFLEAIQAGLDMAARLRKPLPLENLQRYFDWPLEDVRADLNIVAVDANRWTWTEAAWRG